MNISDSGTRTHVTGPTWLYLNWSRDGRNMVWIIYRFARVGSWRKINRAKNNSSSTGLIIVAQSTGSGLYSNVNPDWDAAVLSEANYYMEGHRSLTNLILCHRELNNITSGNDLTCWDNNDNESPVPKILLCVPHDTIIHHWLTRASIHLPL